MLVKSSRGTQFRQWANRVLRDYLLNGYTTAPQRVSSLRDHRQSHGRNRVLVSAKMC